MKDQHLKKGWYSRIPHAIVLLFSIIILVSILTYILPAGKYERITIDGRSMVVPGSYHQISNTPVSLLDMFKAIPLGFKTAVEIIFIVLAGGIMFNIMNTTHAVENAIGTLVNKLGNKQRYGIVVIMTFFYGFLGVAVGYENNIALVPIAAVLSLALGGDLILAAGISVGAMTVGFGLSPINPYTVGTGQKIAELSLFSGAWLRSILCFFGLSFMAYYNVRYLKKITEDPERSLGTGLNVEGISLTKKIADYSMGKTDVTILSIFIAGILLILWGVFYRHWYINELSAVFLMIAVASGLAARMNAGRFSESVLEGVAQAAPGAFMVGFATSIKVLMEMGNINDTISYQMAEALQGLPHYLSAIGMSVSQSVINFFIPSGSGQALATLPIMIPLGEVLGLTRQTTILAFQIGDGVTNLINPTLGGLIAMLSMCRVPIDRWLKFIFPVLLVILIVSWAALIVATAINYS